MMVLSRFFSEPPFFFSKWLPYRKNVNFVWLQCTLISWGTFMWQTWWKCRKKIWTAIFFPKMAAILRNINLVGFDWKLRTWGNLMWRTWWRLFIVFRATNFFLCPHILLAMACFGSQVSDSGSWEPLVCAWGTDYFTYKQGGVRVMCFFF